MQKLILFLIGASTVNFAFLLGAAEPARKLDWGTMREFNYRTGRITSNLKQYDGVTVRVLGFVVPLDDEAQRVSEFLLVPHDGACIHVPPPPPNQMVFVKMPAGKPASIKLGQPVWVEGQLRISAAKSPYGDVGFEIRAEKTESAR